MFQHLIEQPDGTLQHDGETVGHSLRQKGPAAFQFTDLEGRTRWARRVTRSTDPSAQQHAGQVAQRKAERAAAQRQVQLEAEQLAQLARFRSNWALVDQLGAEADRLGIARTHLVELMRAENYDLAKLLGELPEYSIGTFARTYWEAQAAQRPNGGA